MYSKYAYGIPDNPNSAYNFILNHGSYDAGLELRNDTTKTEVGNKGLRINHSSSDNTTLDLRSSTGAVNSFSFRLQDDAAPSSFSDMMILTDDNKSSSSVYGMKVGGRVKASQYFIGENDTRTPSTPGLYIGQDTNSGAYFNMNYGSGEGGFKFSTYDSTGNTKTSNLELDRFGYAKMPYYSSTSDPLDTESSSAFATFDSTGKLIRDYQQNARLRSSESRASTLESTVLPSISGKVNEIISRMNAVAFFNSNISNMVLGQTPVAYTPPAASTTLNMNVDLTTANDPTFQQSLITSTATTLDVNSSQVSIGSITSGTGASGGRFTVGSGVNIEIIIAPDPTGVKKVNPQVAAQKLAVQAQSTTSPFITTLKQARGGVNPVNTSFVPPTKVVTNITPAPTTPAPTTPAPTTPAPTTPAPTTPAPTTPAPTTPAPTTPAPTTPPVPYIIPGGLVSRFPFDNNALDKMGVISAPTVTGTTVYSSGVYKVGGSSIDFTANSGTAGSSVSQLVYGGMGLNMNGTFSISLWINPSSTAASQLPLSLCPTTSSYAYELYLSTTGYISTGYSGVTDLVVSSNGLIVTGNWYHVVMTFDAGLHSLYVNGELIGTHASIGNNPLNYMYLGGGHQGSWNYKGYIDELCIFNRCLTAGEVLGMYDMNYQQLVSPLTYDTQMTSSGFLASNTGNTSGATMYPLTKTASSPVTYQISSDSATYQYAGNAFYKQDRIQDYSSFTCSFEFKTDTTANAGGWLGFNCGLNNPGKEVHGFHWYRDYSPGCAVVFQIYPADYNTAGEGTYLNLEDPTCSGWCAPEGGASAIGNITAAGKPWSGNTNWIKCTITYTNSTTDTWVVSLNGTTVIKYSNPHHVAWKNGTGNYWGITGFSGNWMRSNIYIRNVELNYNPSLYLFSKFTFTPNGATGRVGPASLTYNTTTYPWVSSYITLASGIQRWTVPKTGNYQLVAAGAKGGNNANGSTLGGNGIIVTTIVSLTKGDVLYILVGQQGITPTGSSWSAGGGGGGTFIAKYNGGAINSASSYTLLLVGGGGGGGGSVGGNMHANNTTSARNDSSNVSIGGKDGNGGTSKTPDGGGAAGGGWLTDGQASWGGEPGGAGLSFLNGGTGGISGTNTSNYPGVGGQGGFGGGGGGGANSFIGAGAGGGYSGGGAGRYQDWYTSTSGGGGGSYDINGIGNAAHSTGYNTGDGYAVITYTSSAVPADTFMPKVYTNTQYFLIGDDNGQPWWWGGGSVDGWATAEVCQNNAASYGAKVAYYSGPGGRCNWYNEPLSLGNKSGGWGPALTKRAVPAGQTSWQLIEINTELPLS